MYSIKYHCVSIYSIVFSYCWQNARLQHFKTGSLRTSCSSLSVQFSSILCFTRKMHFSSVLFPPPPFYLKCPSLKKIIHFLSKHHKQTRSKKFKMIWNTVVKLIIRRRVVHEQTIFKMRLENAMQRKCLWKCILLHCRRCEAHVYRELRNGKICGKIPPK